MGARRPSPAVFNRFTSHRRNSYVSAPSYAHPEGAAGAAGTVVACAEEDPLTLPVVFELRLHCEFGLAYAVLGDDEALGAWDAPQGLRLEVIAHRAQCLAQHERMRNAHHRCSCAPVITAIHS